MRHHVGYINGEQYINMIMHR